MTAADTEQNIAETDAQRAEAQFDASDALMQAGRFAETEVAQPV